MATMTPEQYKLWLARTLHQPAREGIKAESELHDQILQDCRRRGWIALHGSMAHSTFRTPGEWDFTILADLGRVFLVECKSREGKLSTDQAALHAWAQKLGHAVYTVRNLQQYIEIVR